MSLKITHIQGGMREFERTGIYPEYLLFNLPGTRHDDWGCRFRKVKSDGSFSEWRRPETMIIEMKD